MNDETENQDSQIPEGTDATPEDDAIPDESLTPDAAPEGETLEEQNARLAEANRRLYARLQKTKAKGETPKPTPAPAKAEKAADPSEELIRARLEVRGFLDEAEQDVILKYAKGLGISPMLASGDELITAKIAQMRKERKTNDAIPSPSGKANTKQTNSVEYWIEKGEIPDDPETFEKVQKELIRRSKENQQITNPNY